jgi:hypothetical protein
VAVGGDKKAGSYLQEMFPAPNRRCAANASARCKPSHICKNHFASFAFCLLCADIVEKLVVVRVCGS